MAQTSSLRKLYWLYITEPIMFEVDCLTLFLPFDFYLDFDLDFTLLCGTAGTLLFIVSPLEEFLIFFLDFRGSIDFF